MMCLNAALMTQFRVEALAEALGLSVVSLVTEFRAQFLGFSLS